MSTQRQIFEIEVQASDFEEFTTKRWTLGIDNLNALSMWEMLRALDKLKPAKRTEVLARPERARRIARLDRPFRTYRMGHENRQRPTPGGASARPVRGSRVGPRLKSGNASLSEVRFSKTPVSSIFVLGI